MISEEQRKQYQQEGYIIFENLFTEAEMDTLVSRIDELEKEKEQKLQETGDERISKAGKINFVKNLSFKDTKIQKFCAQEKFVEITTDILGPNTQLYWDQAVYKRPEADRDFPWHQDNGYVPTDPVHYVTCWLALEDATIENGCIWVQPGTHQKGLVEHKKTDTGWQCYFGDEEGVPVPLKKGSMVAFHSLLFHRSTPNLSNDTRKAYILQYSVEGAKHAKTGKVFENGPVIAREGKPEYAAQNKSIYN